MSTIIDLLGQHAAHKEIVLEGLRPLPDNCTEVTMYISQPTSLGNRERISANVVFNFLQANKVHTHLCVLTGLCTCFTQFTCTWICVYMCICTYVQYNIFVKVCTVCMYFV